MNMHMYSARKILCRLTIVSVSIFFTLILSEIVLRFFFSSAENYYIWAPYYHAVFRPLPNITPGIYGESKFIINSKGIRGNEIPLTATYKILAIGGSTTECILLDQDEAWPYLLQKKLIQAADEDIWVGNAGKSGNTTRHHILQMGYLLQQLPDTNAIMVLTGINDLTVALSRRFGSIKQNESEEELLMSAFGIIPVYSKSKIPYYKKTSIWHMCKRFRYLFLLPSQRENNNGRQYITWRKHRDSAIAIRNSLPDMSEALTEYSKNINTMIDLAEKKGIRIIFITQPVLWSSSLSEELKSLLWLGGVGNFQKEKGKEYYSIDALSNGMDMYNKVLLKACRDRQVECIDLAPLLPKDTAVFYDDCHFNESGSEKVSEILAQYMLQNEPFK